MRLHITTVTAYCCKLFIAVSSVSLAAKASWLACLSVLTKILKILHLYLVQEHFRLSHDRFSSKKVVVLLNVSLFHITLTISLSHI